LNFYQKQNQRIHRTHITNSITIMIFFLMMNSIIVNAGESSCLDEYIQTALENNPGIKSLYHNWQSEIQQIAVVRGLPNPTIGFGYFLQKVETAVGPQEYKLGITQMIPWFGKLKLQGNIQTLKAEISHYEIQQRSNEIRSDVIQKYYDYYLLNRSIAITKQNVALVRHWENLVRSKYTSAQQAYGDLLNVQIELRQIEENLTSLQEQREVLLGHFRALLNSPELEEIALPDSLSFITRSFEPEIIESIFKKRNPKYLAAQTRIELAETRLKHQKLNYYPDFGIGTDYIFTGEKFINGSKVSGSGKDPFVASVSLSMPIWLKKQKAGLRLAEYQIQSSLENRQHLENQLNAEIIDLLNQIEDAHRRIYLFRNDLIPKSIELLNTSETAYITGNFDFKSLIDAQRKYLHFLLEYERSLAEYYQILAELELLSGISL